MVVRVGRRRSALRVANLRVATLWRALWWVATLLRATLLLVRVLRGETTGSRRRTPARRRLLLVLLLAEARCADVLAAGHLEEERLEVDVLLLDPVHRGARLRGDLGDLLGGDGADRQSPVRSALDVLVARFAQRTHELVRLVGLHQDPAGSLGTQLVERTVVHRLTPADDHDLVDGLLDLTQQVTRDQHRPAARGEVPEEATQPRDALGVEAVRRLVEDQHLRVAQQCRGQGEALPHTEREALGLASARLVETDQAEHLVDDAVGRPDRGGEAAQVVVGGPRRMETLRLQYGADHPGWIAELIEAAAVDGRLARSGMHQSEQHAKRGGLPGPIRAEEAGDGAWLHGEAQVLYRCDRPELFGQALHNDSAGAVVHMSSPDVGMSRGHPASSMRRASHAWW